MDRIWDGQNLSINNMADLLSIQQTCCPSSRPLVHAAVFRSVRCSDRSAIRDIFGHVSFSCVENDKNVKNV